MEITPPIFLLQQLRDKTDYQDLPAIQIEYLILAAGKEWGLIPGVHGGVQVVSPERCFQLLGENWCQGCPMSQRGWAVSWQWDWAPSAQPAPNPTSHSPAANCMHSLFQHVGDLAGPSSDKPRVWAPTGMLLGCSGGVLTPHTAPGPALSQCMASLMCSSLP